MVCGNGEGTQAIVGGAAEIRALFVLAEILHLHMNQCIAGLFMGVLSFVTGGLGRLREGLKNISFSSGLSEVCTGSLCD